MPFIPSPQQKAVFAWVMGGQGNSFVEAVAGSGKTTTLIESCKRMQGSVAFAAYNRKIADEIKMRVGTLNLGNVRAGTFHSFGYSAWRRVYPACVVDERAKRDQMLDFLNPPMNIRGLVCTLVSLAKQSAVDALWQSEDTVDWYRFIDHHDLMWNVETDDDEADAARAIELAQQGVVWARATGHELIDFDDMIWLPATTEGVKVWQNDWVLVDEAQDTNPARRLMARRMMNPRRGRAIFVGDRHQAIYGFTGADADAIDQIVRDFQCQSFPLTVTYRCPKSVVSLAQCYVDHITAHESAPEGIVRDIASREDFRTIEIPALHPGDAILCRKTAPLVSLAFSLIRQRIPAHVEGREIGQGLANLIKRWKKIVTVEDLKDKLDAWFERESERLIRKKQEARIEQLQDRIDTIKILAEDCELVSEVLEKISSIFRDATNGTPTTVILSTVHKAKGREWDRVYILGFREYMPSKMARQPWQMQQERNIIYVAVTRAKSELVTMTALEDPTPIKGMKRVARPRKIRVRR